MHYIQHKSFLRKGKNPLASQGLGNTALWLLTFLSDKGKAEAALTFRKEQIHGTNKLGFFYARQEAILLSSSG